MTEKGRISHKSRVAQCIRSFCLFKSRRKDEFHPGVSDGTVWSTPWLQEIFPTLQYHISETHFLERERGVCVGKPMQEGWGQFPSLLVCHLNPSNFFCFRKNHPLLPESRCYSPSPPDCSVCRSARSMFLLLSNGDRLLHCIEFIFNFVMSHCSLYNFSSISFSTCLTKHKVFNQ